MCLLAMATPLLAPAQAHAAADIRLHLSLPGQARGGAVPAVVWLKPLNGTPETPFQPNGHYTLMQKNRMFQPHLLIIPVGATVDFPNADPFFHNVFSLFDGKRFDLGLYEAGSSKQVVFSREGVSYIFCNIHPEMSAVVVALSTPLYAAADAHEAVVVRAVRPGDYRMNLWIEGVPQSILSSLARNLHVSAENLDLGEIEVPVAPKMTHTNKFGVEYDKVPKDHY